MKAVRALIVTAAVTGSLAAGGAVAAAADSGTPAAPPGCVLAAPDTYGRVFGLCPGDQYNPGQLFQQLPGYPTSPAPTTTAPQPAVTVTVTVTVTKVKVVRCHWWCPVRG